MNQTHDTSRNLILIGMPGAGKTTVGKLLAEKLGLCFCDTDDLLQEQYGMTIAGILDTYGVDGFIERENQLCASVSLTECVIATGGSVVYGREAMRHLSAIGRIIYLRVSEETDRGNLSDLPTRGVVMRPGQTFSDLYRERTPLYEKYADLTVDCDAFRQKNGSATAEAVAGYLSELLAGECFR